MPNLFSQACTGLLCSLSVFGVAQAEVKQMPWENSPPPRLLEDRVRVEVGLWNTAIDTVIRADETNQQPGTTLDAEADVGLPDSRLMPDIELVLLPGERQLFRLNGLSSHRNGSAVLTRDVEFDGNAYQIGDLAKSTLNLDMVGVGYAYRLFKKPRFEMDVGVDIQIASVEANVFVPLRGVRESDAGVAPIPLLDVESRWEVLPKWQLQARYRWLGGSGGDVSGRFLDWRAGVQWQFSQHLGVGLHYRHFGIQMDSYSGSHPGAIRLNYSGAQLAFRASL
ncbi:MAG: hypothetical protein AB7F79_13335 [Steroidobacteraceae bacterium]